MRKAIVISVLLLALGAYVYFFRVRPSQIHDPTVRGSGTVEATEVVIAPRIAARIAGIAAQEGDRVQAGQTLVTLDCADITARVAQAEAQVAAAEAGARQAQAAQDQAQAARSQAEAGVSPLSVTRDRAARELERMNQLSGIEGVPQRAVDDAKSAVKTVEEQIAAARKGVTVSGKAVTLAGRAVETALAQVDLAKRAVEVARTQLAECELRSPIGGTVSRRSYEPGELALPGAAVLEVVDLGDTYTWIYVSNEEVGRVRPGQAVEVVADTYPGRAFPGKVVRVSDRAEFTPKSIQTKEDRTRLVFGVKVALANADGVLLPGMPVEAALVEDRAPARAK